MAQKWASTFKIPRVNGKDWSKSSIAHHLTVVDGLRPQYRKPKTWERLVNTWQWVKSFLMKMMCKDNVSFTVENLLTDRQYITAAMVEAYETSVAISAVTSVSQAVGLAMLMSGARKEQWQHIDMVIVKQVCARERSQAPRKMHALSTKHAREIHAGWGFSKSLVDRMVAAAIVVAFLKLLRFSDFALINVGSIY
jgi:hypothetical protein